MMPLDTKGHPTVAAGCAGEAIIGRCSLCGGPVAVPTVWAGITAPRPKCTRCGAVKAEERGPVIQMERPDTGLDGSFERALKNLSARVKRLEFWSGGPR